MRIHRLFWFGALAIAVASGCDDGSDAASVVDQGMPDMAADPYAAWPDPATVFPAVYTPEEGLENWADVRWETETWGPTDVEAGLYVRKLFQQRKGAPVESLAHFEAMNDALPPLGDGITLAFGGDTLWVPDNWSAFATGAAGVLAADLRIGNLESVASAEHEVTREGLPVRFNMPPEVFDALPFDVLQLNNNHTYDMDAAGVTSTKAGAEAAGYTTMGVDDQPIVTVGDKRVALMSFTWGLNRRDLEPQHDVFIVPFGHIGEDIDLSPIQAQIDAARAEGVDHVVVVLHWGFEYEHFPDPHFMVLARRIIAMGADVISAEGPHVVQPAELCHVNQPEHVPGVGTCSIRTEDGVPRDAAVFYSLGNFSTEPDPAGTVYEVGIIGKVSLGDGGVTGMGWTPVTALHEPSRVEPLETNLDDAERAAEHVRLQEHLGVGWFIPAP
ncbi:MAG: CapA family protein [Myxococcales bacterium]|nr:CapA family protein [Myxococcales bacterium]